MYIHMASGGRLYVHAPVLNLSIFAYWTHIHFQPHDALSCHEQTLLSIVR